MAAYAMPETTRTRELPKAAPSGPHASWPMGIATNEPRAS